MACEGGGSVVAWASGRELAVRSSEETTRTVIGFGHKKAFGDLPETPWGQAGYA